MKDIVNPIVLFVSKKQATENGLAQFKQLNITHLCVEDKEDKQVAKGYRNLDECLSEQFRNLIHQIFKECIDYFNIDTSVNVKNSVLFFDAINIKCDTVELECYDKVKKLQNQVNGLMFKEIEFKHTDNTPVPVVKEEVKVDTELKLKEQWDALQKFFSDKLLLRLSGNNAWPHKQLLELETKKDITLFSIKDLYKCIYDCLEDVKCTFSNGFVYGLIQELNALIRNLIKEADVVNASLGKAKYKWKGNHIKDIDEVICLRSEHFANSCLPSYKYGEKHWVQLLKLSVQDLHKINYHLLYNYMKANDQYDIPPVKLVKII